MDEETRTAGPDTTGGDTIVVDSDESFRKTYFPQAFAKEQRERDSGAVIGSELGKESAVLIRSAFSK
jgi:hypothetical protein